MRKPPFLKPGSTIAIAATARFADEAMVSKGKEMLEQEGYNVRIAPNVFQPHHRFAGDDDARTQSLQALLNDPYIDAVWFARGGYGTVRIIDRLDWEGFLNHPKWLIGFSDMTLLHLQVNKLNLESIHACTFTQAGKFGINNRNVSSTLRALKGENIDYTFPSSSFNKNGKAEGVLCGGNLSILCNVMGTSLQPEWTNCILLLEDIDEYLYHYERMLFQLKRSGVFDKIRGLIFGKSTIRPEPDDIHFGTDLESLTLELLRDYSFPVVFDAPFGHTNENYALRSGSLLRLDIDKTNVRMNQL